MGKITFTLEAQIDGEPGPDMAVALQTALLKAINRAAARECSELGRNQGVDRYDMTAITMAFDDPEAFSVFERREYAAGAALITQACRQIVFYGYEDSTWSHTDALASRRFYGMVEGHPTLLTAEVGFGDGEIEPASIRVITPEQKVLFERSVIEPTATDSPAFN